jgi:hypothetical protein
MPKPPPLSLQEKARPGAGEGGEVHPGGVPAEPDTGGGGIGGVDAPVGPGAVEVQPEGAGLREAAQRP